MTLDRFIKLLKIAILGFILIFEIYYIGKYYLNDTKDELADNGHFLLAIDREITVKMANRIISKLESLKRDNNLKSLLIVLDTPGGSPSASDNLYSYFKTLKKEIPLYIYINSSAASGGYYIAVSGDKIYANKNALIGSIGVVMQNISFQKLANELGVSDDTISLGEYKHFMSPLKNMDDKTKDYLKEYLLEPIYKNFADTVASERKIVDAKRKEYFEGKVFIAGDKKVKGVLVDEILSYPQMVALVKKEQNINVIKKVEYKEKVGDLFSKLLTSAQVLVDKEMMVTFK